MIDDLKNKWSFMKVEEIKDGKFLVSDDETFFVFNPNDHKSFFTEELIDKRNKENMLNYELKRRYENLDFVGMDVCVRSSGVFTGYTMSPDNENISSDLTRLNEECKLIAEAPDKYTFCGYCQSVVPKDFVAEKLEKSCICKFCEETGEKRWKH